MVTLWPHLWPHLYGNTHINGVIYDPIYGSKYGSKWAQKQWFWGCQNTPKCAHFLCKKGVHFSLKNDHFFDQKSGHFWSPKSGIWAQSTWGFNRGQLKMGSKSDPTLFQKGVQKRVVILKKRVGYPFGNLQSKQNVKNGYFGVFQENRSPPNKTVLRLCKTTNQKSVFFHVWRKNKKNAKNSVFHHFNTF